MAGWADEVAAVGERIGRHFARSEPRGRAVGYIRGLLSGVERKNGWQLAEHLGDPTPDGVQHLLARADWDADAVRDDLMGYVHEHLGAPGGVLVVDETGFLKKGTKSAGVARQYTGTAGRIENAQVGVFLAYASPKGHALIDRALYLPKEWTDDRPRCAAAGVPEEVGFATKPRLAEGMVRRAWRAGVTGDAVYGSDGAFRRFLEQGNQPYVLAVRSGQRLWVDLTQVRVDEIAAGLPAGAWRRASAGAGSKGPRWYDWAVVGFGPVDDRGWQLRLLARRRRDRPDERAYYLCRRPADTRWEELVRVAGCRWAVEKSQADCTSRRGWVGTRRICYHRRDGVARVGRVVPATPGGPHRRSRMSDITRRPAPPPRLTPTSAATNGPPPV